MSDVVWGLIAGITDGRNFSIEITRQDEGNDRQYMVSELAKASKFSIPGLPEDPAKVNTTELLRATQDKTLKFEIEKVEESGELVCKVSLVEE